MFKMRCSKWEMISHRVINICRNKRKMTGHRVINMSRDKWKMTSHRVINMSCNMQASGHITLEVAILLPGIVLYMVWLVFFMIFLLDMAVVKSEVIRITDEASVIWDKDGDLPTGEYKLPLKQSIFSSITSSSGSSKVQGKASSRLKKRIRARLMLTRCGGQKVSVGSSNVTAQASLSFSWPFPAALADNLHGLQFTGKGKAPVDDWKDQLRSASAIKELIK